MIELRHRLHAAPELAHADSNRIKALVLIQLSALHSEGLARLARSPEGLLSFIAGLATRAAATNKLFHAAQFDLRGAGTWRVDVAIDGPRGPARVGFDLEAAGPLPRWVELAFWIGWPVVPIVLFGVHQVLVRRRGKRTRHEETGNRQRA